MRAIELQPNLQLEVSADKLALSAKMTSGQLKQDLDPVRVLSVLAQHGVVLDADQQQCVHRMCSAATRVVEGGRVTFATGAAPEPAVQASLEISHSIQPQPGRPIMVTAGTVLASLKRGSDGKPGRDLYGATIPVPPPQASDPAVGVGCVCNDDVVVATADGSLHCSSDRIDVVPVRLHQGRYESTMPPIDFAGDVVIVGDVAEGTRIEASHSVHVEGMIENCHIKAGADIIIAGPIAASGKARLEAAGRIHAQRAQGGELVADEDVQIDQDMSHCVVHAGGVVNIGKRVIGSRISAVGGLTCESLGSVGAAKTIVEIGIDETFRDDYRRAMPVIEAQRKQVAKVRQTVEPLMRNVKQLTGPQKEKATELLCEADEIEHRTGKALNELARRLTSLRARQKLTVEVRDQIHAGVILRFPGVESTLRMAMKGPIRIACRREGTHTLVLGEPIEGKGNSRPIEMRVTGDDRFEALERVINPNGDVPARLSA